VLAEIGPSFDAFAGGGWPLGLTLAVALGGERVRERRRRTALNRAMHELRRPLQALVLAGAPEQRVREALDMAVAAVADLDREINQEPLASTPRPVCLATLVHAAAERWTGPAAARERSLRVSCHTGPALVLADPARIACALDNLLANALEHGTLRVEISATVCGRTARVAVADGGSAGRRSFLAGLLGRRDPRHGHGLAIVTEVAREHGGRFFRMRSERGSIAVIELPLAAPAA
jgi:signal transduction histidine kinase